MSRCPAHRRTPFLPWFVPQHRFLASASHADARSTGRHDRDRAYLQRSAPRRTPRTRHRVTGYRNSRSLDSGIELRSSDGGAAGADGCVRRRKRLPHAIHQRHGSRTSRGGNEIQFLRTVPLPSPPTRDSPMRCIPRNLPGVVLRSLETSQLEITHPVQSLHTDQLGFCSTAQQAFDLRLVVKMPKTPVFAGSSSRPRSSTTAG